MKLASTPPPPPQLSFQFTNSSMITTNNLSPHGIYQEPAHELCHAHNYTKRLDHVRYLRF